MEVLNSFMTWIFKNRLGQIENFKENPLEVQHEIFLDLIEAGKRTKFGKEFNFLSIRTYQEINPIRLPNPIRKALLSGK